MLNLIRVFLTVLWELEDTTCHEGLHSENFGVKWHEGLHEDTHPSKEIEFRNFQRK